MQPSKVDAKQLRFSCYHGTDAAVVLRLFVTLSGSEFLRVMTDKPIIEGRPETFLNICNYLHVATVGDAPFAAFAAGYVSGNTHLDLHLFFTHPDARRRGVGEALLGEIDRVLFHSNIDTISVVPINPSSFAFFKRWAERSNWITITVEELDAEDWEHGDEIMALDTPPGFRLVSLL